MGVFVKRWGLVGVQGDYDRGLHSSYSETRLVLGVEDEYSLWQNGRENNFGNVEAQKYEIWKVWTPQQLKNASSKSFLVAKNRVLEQWPARYQKN